MLCLGSECVDDEGCDGIGEPALDNKMAKTLGEWRVRV